MDINIIKNDDTRPLRKRILIGTPTLGIVRMEWAAARFAQVVPTNWTAANVALGYSHQIPMGYLVADAQNIIVDIAVKDNYEWLFFLEDDVILPLDTFIRLNEYMKKGDVPVVSGLYFLKCNPTEPIVYRGRGNGCFAKFKMGDLVWVDGVPTGCLLIHGSILKLMYEESPYYVTGNNYRVKKVFETPAFVFTDPETNQMRTAAGTSDLYWCDRVMRENVLERSGWKKIAKKRYPFLVDTNILCKHIDLSSGTQFPVQL